VRVTAFDTPTAILSAALRKVHGLTGLLFEPPALGEALPTRHLRRFAAEPDVADALFDVVCNQCMDQGARSICYVEDPRDRIRTRRAVVLRYRLVLYAVARGFDRSRWSSSRPVFFDVTLS
jgi:hypothetical protein